ncbi:hypothetical protein QUB70_19585 [Microcoleus sp. A003_D6]|uniref:hypothetical protein n=1 Tax=Microcoleus sp. A003_D6 TaxID=3055266 RepID=UPI002FCF43C6
MSNDIISGSCDFVCDCVRSNVKQSQAVGCVSVVILNHHRKSHSDAPFIPLCVSFEIVSL